MQKSTHCGLEFDILSSLKGNNNSKNMRNIAGIIKLRYTNKKCQFTVKIGSNTYSLSTTSKWSSARSSWARTRLVYVTIMRSGSHFGYFYFRSAFVTSASLYLKVPNVLCVTCLFWLMARLDFRRLHWNRCASSGSDGLHRTTENYCTSEGGRGMGVCVFFKYPVSA